MPLADLGQRHTCGGDLLAQVGKTLRARLVLFGKQGDLAVSFGLLDLQLVGGLLGLAPAVDGGLGLLGKLAELFGHNGRLAAELGDLLGEPFQAALVLHPLGVGLIHGRAEGVDLLLDVRPLRPQGLGPGGQGGDLPVAVLELAGQVGQFALAPHDPLGLGPA